MRRCRSLTLVLTSLLLSLFLFTVAVAQDEPPVFPTDGPTPATGPSEMEFQPPPDADSLEDFLPPGLAWSHVELPGPGQPGVVVAHAHTTQAVSFIDETAAVIMEAGTVAEDVELQFTLISKRVNDSSAGAEPPTGMLEQPAEETPASTDTTANDGLTAPATLTPTVSVLEATTTPTATATLTETASAGGIPPQTPAPTLTPDINDGATETAPATSNKAPAESPPVRDGPERFIEFQLEAVDLATGEPAGAFKKKARIVLDLRGYGFDVTQGGTFFLAYQDPENPEEWIEVPITSHQSDGLISADVAHFSSWATGWRPEGWTLQWEPPSADGFTGAARTSYSFQLPAGRAGLAPSLSLSYSNAALNGAIKRVSGGDVASGWSLNEIAIVRTGVKMSEGSISAMGYPDKFRLVLNGEGYKLVPGTNGAFYAENAPHLRINRYTDYWTVETGDGTMYRLGYTDAARTWHHFVLNEHLDGDGDPNSHATHHSAYIEWHVDTITDRFGNQVVYQRTRSAVTDHYEEIASCPWGGFCVLDFYTHASRLLNVYYNFQGRQNIPTLPITHTVGTLSPSTAATRVELLYNNQGGRLSDVRIYHNSGGNPIRQYGLVSATRQVANPGCQSGASTRYSATHELTSITEYGWDGATGALRSLPPVSFSYEARNNYVYDNQNCFIFMHLSEVSNGYGGKTKFTYASDSRAVGTYTNTGSGPTEYPQVGYSHYVSQVANFDGRKKSDGINLRSGVINYARSGPCYNQYDSGYGPRCQLNDDAPRFGVLAGFGDVTATYLDYNSSATHLVRTTYHQSATYFGRPIVEEVKNPGGTVLTRMTSAYAAATFGPDVSFVYLAQRDSAEYYFDGTKTHSLVSREKYFYDTAQQGSQQWGKLTNREVWYQKDGAGTYVMSRRDDTWYRTDISRWLVVPWIQSSWLGSQRLQTTLYHYDGQTGNPASQTLSKGLLTRQRALLVNASYVSGGYTKFPTVESMFVYDDYGNQTETRSYSGYGVAGKDATNWSYFEAATGERKTIITYDSAFRLYPVSVRNPALHETKFEVYGFGGSLQGFQRQTGLLKSVTDPNNVVTRYEYDPFGRLHAIFDAEGSYAGFGNTDPWDGNPLQRFRYWDTTWNNSTVFLDPVNNKPFEITLEQRPGTWTQAGNGYAFNDQTFYDGLGRAIQTRSIYAEVEGQSLRREIYTSTDYDARGNVVCQTVPYDLSLYSDPPRNLVWPASPFDRDACTSKARTMTSYDALGRVATVTAPDGSQTRHFYSILNDVVIAGTHGQIAIHKVVDAQNHVTASMANPLGQLMKTRQYTGVYSSESMYVDSDYRYDVMGNLILVEQRAANNTSATAALSTSTMSYDALGRKLGMNDADMGVWSYGYDAAGNLVWQKDAKGKKLCFTYDALDRVKVRFEDSSATDACPTTPPTSGTYHLATYTYDTAAYGKGQLATVSWGLKPAENKDTFFYDNRGRMTKQTRLIDNRPYTLETTSFDPLNRPLTVKYPSTETVTYAYDHEGEDRLWAGGSLLVDKVTYNARGQMARLERGNNVDTVFSYYGATGTAGNSNYRLLSIVAGSLLNLQYQYDKVGNITLMTDGLLPSGLNTQTFTYDELNRLKTAYTPGGATGYYNHTYAYNQIGNITSYAGTGYTYLDNAHKHAVTHLGGTQKFWYDANGNMTKRTEGSLTYVQTFDAENRLATVTNGSAVTTFSYDAAGQRTRTQQPNGVKTYYPFPGYEEEVNGSTTTRRTTYTLAGQAVAVRVQVVGGSNSFYYLHTDHLGSTTTMSHSGTGVGGGSVAGSTARYLPFGGWRTTPTQTLTDRGYTGHLENMEIGLVYMNARYYVPAIGRFASPDTVVPGLDNPQAWNRYAYVANNPLVLTDPSGHCWGFASGLRNTFLGTTCSNLDMAATIVASPDATIAQRAFAGGYIVAEAAAGTMLAVGGAILVAEAAPVAAGYAGTAVMQAQATAAAHPVAAGVVGGTLETAGECALTGGGCTVLDYVAGAATSGLANRLSDPCSFSEETVVLTEDGEEPISEIEPNDRVLAFNEATGEIGYYPVTAVWSHEDPVIITLTIDGETIETTPDHPFYTTDDRWVSAGELQVGDELRSANWQVGTLEGISVNFGPEQMYNLTVTTAHTYFVGDGRWLVHNACPSQRLRANLTSSGVSQPPNTATHHIVAHSDPRAAVARAILAGQGIDIDDAMNGVFLPSNSRVPNPSGANVHSSLHTDVYYKEVNSRLMRAQASTIPNVLGQIRSELLAGNFPH